MHSSRSVSQCGEIDNPATVNRLLLSRMKRNFSNRITAIVVTCITLVVGALSSGESSLAQKRRSESQTSHSRNLLSTEALAMVDLASAVVCRERITDPKGSVPIDDMQSRPSLPVQSPEAIAGAKRAQRLLPIAKDLVASSLKQLARDYNVAGSRLQAAKVQRAIARVMAVNRVRPDMDSRDNASVFLHNPHTIIFGTIFLAGLPSDEGIVSVLAHELVHIADGGEDSLARLFSAVGSRASRLTGARINGQRAEELTCDLVGTLAARGYVAREPNYEPLPRRISRSLAHNCVDQDEGDDDHLSPRTTIRALLSLAPDITRALVYGRWVDNSN